MEFIDLKAQYKKLDSKINNNIKKVLNDSHFIMGEEVKILEKELAGSLVRLLDWQNRLMEFGPVFQNSFRSFPTLFPHYKGTIRFPNLFRILRIN